MWDLNLGVQACQKNSSHFDIGGVYMLHRGTCAISSSHDYTHMLSRFVIKVSVVHMHVGVVLVSNFFLGLHVPHVKETPSLRFSKDDLLLSEV